MEMILVIFIISMLSTIVIAGLGSAREKARDDERVADLAQLQLALEQYYNACGRQYPQPGASDAINSAANDGCPGGSGITLASFIDVPNDPTNTGDYTYTYFVPDDPAYDYILRASFETKHGALGSDVNDEEWSGYTSPPDPDCDDSTETTKPFSYCLKP